MKRALIIFVKNAIKGKVKTRLAATVGDDIAFDTYQQLLSHTARVTNGISVQKIVYYSDYIEHKDGWNEEVYIKKIQIGNALGERMQNAIEHAFLIGNEHVAIIGSDNFEITTEIIEKAFQQLDFNDAVVGPALDGGYYLLALNAIQKELFQHIEWSSAKVLDQTLQVCKQLGLKTAKLQVRSDIDTEVDLKRFLAIKN